MMLPLEIPPGIYRNGTDLQASGRWLDANLIRWVDGATQPIGGWRDFADTTLNAAPRGAHSWVTKTGTPWLAFATYNKIYVIAGDGSVSDVTPAGLTTGIEDAAVNTGFGGGAFGTGTFGTPRPETGVFSAATVWSLDNWGEYLVACSPDDGKLYEWQLNTGTPAAQITNSPTGCTAVMVTDERFVFALGADSNDRSIEWCDREDNTTWTPSATNEAGDFELATSGKISAGLKVRGESLILTTTDAHTATYVGAPFVYSFERVGSACGVAAPKAGAVLDGVAYWMGEESFFVYRGGAVESLNSDVRDYVFSDINRDQISKVFATTIGAFGEVWWFYPSSASTECDRYVFFDTQQGTWGIGQLTRTAAVDKGAARFPVMFDADGVGYQHEVSSYSWGAGTPFAESGPIRLGVGENTFTAKSLFPDERTQGDVQVKFKTRFAPNGDESEFGPYSMAEPSDVLFSGRQMRIRVEGVRADDWRWGIPTMELSARGRR